MPDVEQNGGDRGQVNPDRVQERGLEPHRYVPPPPPPTEVPGSGIGDDSKGQ